MVVFYLRAFSKGGALLMFLSICANVCLKNDKGDDKIMIGIRKISVF